MITAVPGSRVGLMLPVRTREGAQAEERGERHDRREDNRGAMAAHSDVMNAA